jgi:thiol-disulfide isomerase/thioredoxin
MGLEIHTGGILMECLTMRWKYWAGLLLLILASGIAQGADKNSTNQHANLLGETALRLLESRDADRFANDLSLTNQFNRAEVLDSARHVLEQATRMGVEPSRVHFRLKEVRAKATGTGQNPESNVKGEMLPTSFGIRIVLHGEPVQDTQANKSLQGEYELALGGAIEFPDGWRTYEGIRWSRLPDGVPDAQTKGEMAVVSNIVERVGMPLHVADDPALQASGNTLLRFLQKGDAKIYDNEAMASFEEEWEAMLKKLKKNGIKDIPVRTEVEDGWKTRRGALVQSAEGVLSQAKAIGIDFSTAEIALKDASAEQPYMRGGYGRVEGITAGPLRFTFTVKSSQKSKSGQPIAGDYILTAGRGKRTVTCWNITDKIRWEQFPEGLLGEKGLAELAFENYVGEYEVLPPGTAAPDATFVLLGDERTVKLSDFRSKVVVLEWWATSCGPCQGPMAELQTLKEQHPEWRDRVQVITVSIDSGMKEVRAHLAKRGWTNTLNAWAGEGGWMSAAAKEFRLHGLPTCYVLDLQGKVVEAGSPSNLSITNAIARLLR